MTCQISMTCFNVPLETMVVTGKIIRSWNKCVVARIVDDVWIKALCWWVYLVIMSSFSRPLVLYLVSYVAFVLAHFFIIIKWRRLTDFLMTSLPKVSTNWSFFLKFSFQKWWGVPHGFWKVLDNYIFYYWIQSKKPN